MDRRARVALLALAGAAWPMGAAPVQAQEAGTSRTVAVPGTEISIEQVFVPGGTARMGSPENEPGRGDDEGPVHQVQLSGFWMTVTEVTQDQYAPFRFRGFDNQEGPGGAGSFDADAVARPSPPYEDPGHGMGSGDHPATGMTRWNALHYARWLSEKTGQLFRLPTEAEWEYACRSRGSGPWGAGEGGVRLEPAQLEAYAWMSANGLDTTHPVGGKAPNAWGLYDMLGNAAEWVVDGYRAEAYEERTGVDGDGVARDPREGSATSGRGVVRGGAFDDGAEGLRCAERLPEARAWKRRDPQIPKSRWWNTDSPHVGFRLVSPANEMSLEEIRAYWNELLGS